MENKNIIIILVVIIVILAAVIGFMVFLTEGQDMSVKLTDLNKTPLSKQKVNITIKDSKGKVVANKTVKTDDKGNAKMDLKLKKGNYDVAVSYGGNENYSGNNTTQKLTIKEKVVEVKSSSGSSGSNGGNYLEGPEVDSHGVSKQQVMQSGYSDVKYDSENGIYVKYDPKTGVYHD